MKKFNALISKACPLNVPNVDTDQIIPKQFLKRVERTGFELFLFYDWRYLEDGSPNPEFCLNQKKHEHSKILLTQMNFGCGSSREHAAWSILDYGFQCIIAPSFADIFYNNCFQNGILPIILSQKEVDELFSIVDTSPEILIEIDLRKQEIKINDDHSIQEKFTFGIENSRKQKLLEGLDDIGFTLKFEEQIKEFEKSRSFAKAF